MNGTGARPLRVFLSHTSELRDLPADGPFVSAAEAAVIRAGHAVSDMAYFTARDSAPADYCAAKVAEAQVYVGVIGLRYGARVRGRPELSYTELEFEIATRLKLPRLIFLVREGAQPVPPADEAPELVARQRAFRKRLLEEEDLTAAWISSPAELQVGLHQALVDLASLRAAPNLHGRSSASVVLLLRRMRRWSRVFWGTVLFGLLLYLAAQLLATPLHAISLNDAFLQLALTHLGVWGPIGAIIILLTLAIELAGVDAALPGWPVADELDWQNRVRLLDKLEYYYDRALEQYLRNVPRVRLTLRSTPDLVRDSSARTFQAPPSIEAPSHYSTRSVVAAFDRAKGELLIVGEPGAGKTTLLLQLARKLLVRARDGRHQVPLILNLSTWTNRRQLLAEWMVEELQLAYQVSPEIGRHWMAAARLLPILDGLDEVPMAHRRECIEAINTFRSSHLHPLVVCSRSGAYPTDGTLLELHSAFTVQPITAEQVKRHLSEATQLTPSLRAQLGHNRILLELLTTPLMLSMVVATYRRTLDYDVAALNDDEVKSYVLSLYTSYMSNRKVSGARAIYPAAQLRRWLVWLAVQMRNHNQSVFYIERLQTDWLSGGSRGRLLIAGVVGAVVAFFGWIGYTLFYAQHFGALAGVLNGLVVAAACIVIYVIVNGWFLDKMGSSRIINWNRWQGRLATLLASRLFYGLLFGVPIGTLVGVRMGLAFGPLAGLAYTIYNLVSLTSYFVLYGRLASEIRPAHVVRWSWSAAVQGAIRFTPAAVGGGLGIGLVWTDQLGSARAVRLGLLLALVGACVVGLSVGFVYDRIDLRWLNTPNQGIRRSLRNSLLFGSLGGTAASLLYGIAFILAVNPGVATTWAIIAGVTTGQIMALRGGGFDCLQHAALRALLWLEGSTARDLPEFLNYCTDLGLTYRVGGGYAFRHRMLLDHFASIDPARLEPSGPGDPVHCRGSVGGEAAEVDGQYDRWPG